MNKKLFLIGTGPGNPELLTAKAAQLIGECGQVFTTARLAGQVKHIRPDVQACELSKLEEKVLECSETEIAVLVSGDTCFFSMASSLKQKLGAKLEIEEVNGISSMQYLCAKTGISYEHIEVVSLHGREGCFLGQVSYSPVVFFLSGGKTKAQHICAELAANGLRDVEVIAGERLSLADERIVCGTAEELKKCEFSDLTVLLVKNPRCVSCREPLKDSDFIRGRIPMTKEEVRWVSVSKLNVKPDNIVYDIGAGTGSVSIELARAANKGMVYAIEHNDEGICLIEENKNRLGAFNLKVIKGKAPDCIVSLPVPDRAFIGGSGGRLKEILAKLLALNPEIRVTVNAVTLETLKEATDAMAQAGMKPEIINIGVSRAKEAGSHHLMIAQNPVFIITGCIIAEDTQSEDI